MTNRGLKKRLYAVAAIVSYVLLLSFIEYIYHVYHDSVKVTYIGSHATLVALLFAAYLAYIFQQRAKFVDDIRKWWSEIVQAKSDFFIYCDKSTATEDDYLKAFYKLSTAMDTFRLIYCNVDRGSHNPTGYFPFEQVRDIIDLARSVAPARNVSHADRKKVKAAINIVFQSLRHAIQSESSAITPDMPTLVTSPFRESYISDIAQKVGLDLRAIRLANEIDEKASYKP